MLALYYSCVQQHKSHFGGFRFGSTAVALLVFLYVSQPSLVRFLGAGTLCALLLLFCPKRRRGCSSDGRATA